MQLARIWATGQTALVRSPGRGTVLLTGGEAQDAQGLALLAEVLAGLPAEVDVLGHQPTVASVPGAGPLLWSAMLREGIGGDGPLRTRDVVLVDGPARDRLGQLDLSPSLRTVLRLRGPQVPLDLLLARAGTQPEAVTAELRALLTLGILALRAETVPPQGGWELEQLERVLRVLAQASQWRVLDGSPQPHDPAMIAGLNRLRVRYLPRPGVEPEVLRLLQDIHRHLAVLAS